MPRGGIHPSRKHPLRCVTSSFHSEMALNAPCLTITCLRERNPLHYVTLSESIRCSVTPITQRRVSCRSWEATAQGSCEKITINILGENVNL